MVDLHCGNALPEVPAVMQELLRAGRSGLLYHHEPVLCQLLHGREEDLCIWWHPSPSLAANAAARPGLRSPHPRSSV